jgi:hypothetical protein
LPGVVCWKREVGSGGLSESETISRVQLCIDLAELTKSTFPLPVSFTESGNVASNPVSWSARRRKAWCGRFGLPPSVAVNMILRVSDAPSVTGFERGVFSESLVPLQSEMRHEGAAIDVLILGSTANSSLSANREGSVLEFP